MEDRMFRSFRNPGQNAAPLGSAQLQAMNQANQLVASGQPILAAPIFVQLASNMESSNHPRRAANLHAQAAHAFADGQDEQDALVQARRALSLFIQYQMVNRTPVFYANITRKLTNKGMKNSAEALAKEFGPAVRGIPMPAPAAAPRGSLPTSCPKCGAPLRASEANWIDKNTAECEYCGASIRAS
jgi:hypothetical protein